MRGFAKLSAQPWQSDPSASLYTSSKWTQGDKTSWEAAIRARNQNQNEYSRVQLGTTAMTHVAGLGRAFRPCTRDNGASRALRRWLSSGTHGRSRRRLRPTISQKPGGDRALGQGGVHVDQGPARRACSSRRMGETWRQLKNGWITPIAGWLIAGVGRPDRRVLPLARVDQGARLTDRPTHPAVHALRALCSLGGRDQLQHPRRDRASSSCWASTCCFR